MAAKWTVLAHNGRYCDEAIANVAVKSAVILRDLIERGGILSDRHHMERKRAFDPYELPLPFQLLSQ